MGSCHILISCGWYLVRLPYYQCAVDIDRWSFGTGWDSLIQMGELSSTPFHYTRSEYQSLCVISSGMESKTYHSIKWLQYRIGVGNPVVSVRRASFIVRSRHAIE